MLDAADLDSSGRKQGALVLDGSVARAWFSLGNRDFIMVCHLAGLDPMFVANRAVKRIEGDLATRKTLRKKNIRVCDSRRTRRAFNARQ